MNLRKDHYRSEARAGPREAPRAAGRGPPRERAGGAARVGAARTSRCESRSGTVARPRVGRGSDRVVVGGGGGGGVGRGPGPRFPLERSRAPRRPRLGSGAWRRRRRRPAWCGGGVVSAVGGGIASPALSLLSPFPPPGVGAREGGRRASLPGRLTRLGRLGRRRRSARRRRRLPAAAAPLLGRGVWDGRGSTPVPGPASRRGPLPHSPRGVPRRPFSQRFHGPLARPSRPSLSRCLALSLTSGPPPPLRAPGPPTTGAHHLPWCLRALARPKVSLWPLPRSRSHVVPSSPPPLLSPAARPSGAQGGLSVGGGGPGRRGCGAGVRENAVAPRGRTSGPRVAVWLAEEGGAVAARGGGWSWGKDERGGRLTGPGGRVCVRGSRGRSGGRRRRRPSSGGRSALRAAGPPRGDGGGCLSRPPDRPPRWIPRQRRGGACSAPEGGRPFFPRLRPPSPRRPAPRSRRRSGRPPSLDRPRPGT